MVLTYQKALQKDAELLINLYNAAFYDDYVRYGECPGYGRTKEEMEQSILRFPKYIIMKDGRPVGVISFENRGQGDYYIGCLCVIPSYQGMGIGRQAFQYMLSVCPDWKRISLVTPADKKQNIQFYTQKCGFLIGNKEMDGQVEVVHLYRERLSQSIQ